MSIDNSTVRKVANLARIKLDDQSSEERLKEELNKILGWIDELKKVDTSNVKPLTHVIDDCNVVREDSAGTCIENKKFIDNCPDSFGQYIKVPRILDKD